MHKFGGGGERGLLRLRKNHERHGTGKGNSTKAFWDPHHAAQESGSFVLLTLSQKGLPVLLEIAAIDSTLSCGGKEARECAG